MYRRLEGSAPAGTARGQGPPHGFSVPHRALDSNVYSKNGNPPFAAWICMGNRGYAMGNVKFRRRLYGEPTCRGCADWRAASR